MEFILIVLVIILFFYIQSVSSRLSSLERKLSGSRVAPAPQLPPSPVQQTPLNVAPAPMQAEVASSLPASPADGFHKDLGTITASQWLTGIGVLALIFGIGFFLKYAIDQNWISETVRILIGVVVGLLLISAGEVWHKKYQNYAAMLTGGGIAILYFSIFAGYQFYHLLSQPIAFLIMIIITAGGILLAFRYNSKYLAIVALIGGYLAPVLINSGENRQVALFTYLTLLNFAVLMVMLRGFWFELLFVSLIGALFDFSLWAGSFANKDNTLTSVGFIFLNFFVISMSVSLLFRKFAEKKELPKKGDAGLAMFHLLAGFIVILGLVFLLDRDFHAYLAPVSFLFGVLMLLSYALIDRLEYKLLNYCQSFVAAGFLVASIAWQFSGTTLDSYLLVLGLIGVCAGLGLRRKELRSWGLVILFGATLKTLLEDYGTMYTFLFNAKFITEAFAIICAIVVELLYSRSLIEENEKPVPDFFRVLAAGVFWFATSWEIVKYFQGTQSENIQNLSLSIWWMAYAVILMILGVVRRYAVLRQVSIALFIVTILKVFLYDVQALDTGYRIVSFITLGVILLSVSFAYQKHKEKFQQFIKG